MARNHWPWLGLLVLAAFALRLYAINFGLPGLNDPDELMFEMGALRMLRTATLNPGWFGHPATVTMYLLALIDIFVFCVGWLAGAWTGAGGFIAAIYHNPGIMVLPGRVMIAIFSVLSIAMTARLGREIAGRRAGFLAALLLAANPVHVTYSQIVRSDMMGCVFMLGCLLAALRIARLDRTRDYAIAALWLALSVATKWPFAITALPVAAAAALAWHRGLGSGSGIVVRLTTFALLAPLFLVLIAPYLVIDWRTVIDNLHGEEQYRHLGANGGSLLFNMKWYLLNPLRKAMGIAGILLAGLGLVLSLALPRLRTEVLVIVATGAVAFFVLISSQHLVWERWALPLMPYLAILAAIGLDRSWRWFVWRWPALRRSSACRRLVAGLSLSALLGPLVADAVQHGYASLHDTRQQAAAWVQKHVPPQSTIYAEHFAFDMLRGPWRFRFPMGDAGCVDPRAFLAKRKGYATIQHSRGSRSIVDYGTMPAQLRATCNVDYAVLSQYARYRAERTLFPQEYAAYRRWIAQGHIVATFRPREGLNSGPEITIVRFTHSGRAHAATPPRVNNPTAAMPVRQ